MTPIFVASWAMQNEVSGCEKFQAVQLARPFRPDSWQVAKGFFQSDFACLLHEVERTFSRLL
jgi:hypothetical protein